MKLTFDFDMWLLNRHCKNCGKTKFGHDSISYPDEDRFGEDAGTTQLACRRGGSRFEKRYEMCGAFRVNH